MEEIKIKESFQRVKSDINSLKETLEKLKNEIQEIKRTLKQTDNQTDRPTSTILAQTLSPTLQTHPPTNPTMSQISEDNLSFKTLKTQNFDVSTGNRGVPADRQTIRQTDNQTDNDKYMFISKSNSKGSIQKFALRKNFDDPIMKIEKVTELVNSLDTLKKDLRKQFKKLTPQEMLVFSTIYQLTDQAIEVDYSTLSTKTNLSESSIRDYVRKLLKKGVPLEKNRENNKRILLSIPGEFKRIASLDTLLSLRSL